MSPTGTWTPSPLALWWWLSRSCNLLTLFGSSVVTLGISLFTVVVLATPGFLYPSRCDVSPSLATSSLLSSAFNQRELQKPYTQELMIRT